MSSPSPSIGQVLGHYRILEQIGAGGMGVVFRAHDLQLERDVALKVLPPGTFTDPAARKRFRNEALALARLTDPNIAVIHDFGSDGEVDFLVMEYVRGVTLASRLKTEISEKLLLRIGEQIARALQRAHDAGIVHGDLKPGNIMVTDGGEVKLLDFGMASLMPSRNLGASAETLTFVHRFGGTLPYMSPEQLKGEAVDGRSDIYSAGVVFYEMATGRRPFEGKLSSVIVNQIINTPPAPPCRLARSLSPRLEEIILKCLDKDPDHRYQSARELATDLRRLTQPQPPAPARQRRPRVSRRWLGIIVLPVAALLLLFVVLRMRPLSSRAGADQPRISSIAVLPIANLAHDPAQDYLADGMTEALITNLGQIHSLRRVISRTSVMQFKSDLKSVPEIGRELDVDAVVEGSVLRSGSSFELTVRLVNAATDAQLWSETYQRKMGDVIALQRELALDIVNNIRVNLTPGEQARFRQVPSVNPEVQDLYLKGRYLDKGDYEQQQRARQYFERAIRLDPNYAPAYAGLAESYSFTPQRSRSDAAPQAEQYALQALQLDPNLAAAHTSLGILRFYADWDWAAAEKEFRRAIELNPNDAEAHRIYAVYLSAQNRPQQAQAEIARAQELDPLYLWTQITAGFVAYFARRYDDALAQCRRALDLDPNSAGGQDCVGEAYLGKSMYSEAITAGERAVQLSGRDSSRLVGLGRAYALAGRKRQAEQVLRELRQNYTRSHVSPYYLATLEVALGHNRKALAWLQTAYRERDSYLIWAKVDSALDPLRSQPGFHALLQRLGFTPPNTVAASSKLAQ